MALTSASFMTGPGMWTSTLADKLDIIDCSQVLAAVLMDDKAILGHIKMGPTAKNIEVNWIEDSLNAAFIYSSAASAVGSVQCGAYTTASLAKHIRLNTVLHPESTDFLLQLTTTATVNTLTCTVYGSTTFAAWTATKKLYIVAQPYADIADASSDVSKVRTKGRNFMQVLERAVEIEQSRKGIAMEAVTDDLKMQILRRTMEIKRELDMSVIIGYGKTTASNTYSADHELRTMCGIINLVRDPNLDTTNEDTTVTDVSGGLTSGHINSLAYKIFDAGGLDETSDPIIVVGGKQMRVISAMEQDIRRTAHDERTVGYYKKLFLTDMGVEMPVVLDRWTPYDKLIILDRSRAALRALSGDSWHAEKMGKSGRNEKWQISGQYSLELRNADSCHGMLKGLT